MTAKKKPRTGGDGASSNSLHGDDGSWGELSITAILRPGREHRKTTGAGGTGLSPARLPIAILERAPLERGQRSLG
jgi:hypothetical protein